MGDSSRHATEEAVLDTDCLNSAISDFWVLVVREGRQEHPVATVRDQVGPDLRFRSAEQDPTGIDARLDAVKERIHNRWLRVRTKCDLDISVDDERVVDAGQSDSEVIVMHEREKLTQGASRCEVRANHGVGEL